ncbi:acyltransferase family protein [Cupriavidus sp. 2TAF22]|uniref:acyltransferase family protein n=1 Tax=unclassified Cupriavidus TaxID=2640874 RepID=UPI003F91758E
MHIEYPRSPASGEPNSGIDAPCPQALLKQRLGGGHLRPLDGMRGVAVLLVFFHHSVVAAALGGTGTLDHIVVKLLASGWVGVDIFFALSGFLITGILLDAKGTQRYFANFYAKRTLRIFPLYYFFLILFFLVLRPFLAEIYRPGNDYADLLHAQAWFWSYMQNWYFARLGEGSPVPVTQLWSLAIEEQFYLVWPLVVFLCTARRVVVVSLVLCVASPVLRFLLIRDGWDQMAIYVSTLTHIDPLLYGALVAAYARGGFALPTGRQVLRWLAALATISAALVVVLDGGLKRDGLALQTFGFSTLGACSALLIAAMLLLPAGSRLNLVASHPVLRMFGKYSYSLYVFHPPVLYGLAWLVRTRSGLLPHNGSVLSAGYLAYMLASLLLCMLASLTTWHLFEARLLRLKRYFTAQPGHPRGEAGGSLPVPDL